MNERIKEIRRVLNLTQQEFSERIGLKRNSIALIESGRPTSDQTVIAICREFNVNEKWLRTGEGEMFRPDPVGELDALARKFEMSQMEYVFLERYFKLKKEEREKIFEFLQDVFRTVLESEPEEPDEPDDDLDIDAEVEAYRRQLEDQKKARARSSASHGTGAAGGSKLEA